MVKEGSACKVTRRALIRLIHERGYRREQIQRRFVITVRMIQLPYGLGREFPRVAHVIEKGSKAPYINIAKRHGIEKDF